MSMAKLEGISLTDFGISKTIGFLLDRPLKKLPEYFEEWNALAKEAPKLASQDKKLRDKVQRLPLLDHERLTTYRELRLAHLTLCAIATCYIWQEGDKGVPKVLPRTLAVPWCGVSRRLGLKPVTCIAAFVLANFKIKDANRPVDLTNLECLYEVVPGGRQAEWFAIVSAMIEYDFAPAITHIVEAISAADGNDVVVYKNSMAGIRDSIIKMRNTLSRMHDELDADVFYNVVRPYFNGWGGQDSPLPEGLIYEGVSEEPQKMIGGSNAQSSTLHLTDAALGIKHNNDITEYLRKVSTYMPPKHVEFTELIAKETNIRTFALDRDEEIWDSYNKAVQAVIDFRSYHIQIVTKYVIIAASKETRSRDYESVSSKGTGGSSLIPFLKSIRDTTAQAIID
ncbi:myoglobin-like isoform X2 [Ostrea edulis]|uniref:myoglobin-like isoform X2 n=1 Tax=Ostrea edulis TaxID=37623 RepID=UPI0024AFC0B6|nr:myoglobin-like isoform X2 [Ostrea edulis]